MKIDRKAFKERLIYKSEELGCSPASIAKSLNLERQTVDHWFQGRSMPRANRMKALAELLGVSVSWLKRGVKILDDIPVNPVDTLRKIAALAPQNSSESTKQPQGSTNVQERGVLYLDMNQKALDEIKNYIDDPEMAIELAQALFYIKKHKRDSYNDIVDKILGLYRRLKIEHQKKIEDKLA